MNIEISKKVVVGGIYRCTYKELILFPWKNSSRISIIYYDDIITIVGIEEVIGFTDIVVKILHKDNIGLVFLRTLIGLKLHLK